MSKYKETQEDKIIQFLESFVDAKCDKCNKQETFHQMDDYDAAGVMVRDGWYATPNYLYCPSCQKKRKSKTKIKKTARKK